MKKLLSIFALVFAFPAFAADLPARSAPVQYASPAPVSPWAGFYIGAHVGYTVDTTTGTNFMVLQNAIATRDPEGIVWGGQIGYRAQAGKMVMGVETDMSAAGLHKTMTVPNVGGSFKSSIDYFGSSRAVFGFTPLDHMMVYATGGVGWGHSNGTITAGLLSDQAAAVHFGPVMGGGVEFDIGNKLKLGLEYLHYDLGRASYAFSFPIQVNAPTQLKMDVVRAKVAWSFN